MIVLCVLSSIGCILVGVFSHPFGLSNMGAIVIGIMGIYAGILVAIRRYLEINKWQDDTLQETLDLTAKVYNEISESQRKLIQEFLDNVEKRTGDK